MNYTYLKQYMPALAKAICLKVDDLHLCYVYKNLMLIFVVLYRLLKNDPPVCLRHFKK
jgi:hypothetical protein